MFGLDVLTSVYLVLVGIGVLLVVLGLFGIEISDFLGLETMTLASIFVFLGGFGLVFNAFGFSVAVGLLLSIAVTIVLSSILHFSVVKSMKKAESSTSVSEQSFKHKLGTVTITIPANGTGEIKLKDGFNTHLMAESLFEVEIVEGSIVYIDDIIEGVAKVTLQSE